MGTPRVGRTSKWRKTATGATYGVLRATPAIHEVQQSLAYKSLTPTERLILRDMLRQYFLVSNWDRTPPPLGFAYTWSQCAEQVSERVFYAALRQIARIGFFTTPPEIQERRAAAPRRFARSTAWLNFDARSAKAENVSRRECDKSKRLAEKKRRRADYRAGLLAKNSTPRKVADESARNVADTLRALSNLSARKVADIKPESEGFRCTRSSRSPITIPCVKTPSWFVLKKYAPNGTFLL